MGKVQKTRLGWVELYEQIKDAGIVCRKCGISRPTLRKWLERYKEQEVSGLKELTRRVLNSPKKVAIEQEEIILSLRNNRKLGVRRVQSSNSKYEMLIKRRTIRIL